MKRSVKGWMLGGGICLVATTFLVPRVEARHRRNCISPNGVNDTEALQVALDRCSGARRRCEVRLCAGVFRTAPLRVGDFRGKLRGAGQDRTRIEALPGLEVNSNPDGYWQDHPLDPALDPWPYLLQFVEGRGEIRDLSIVVPSLSGGESPTTGWVELFGFTSFELAGAILVTGQQSVDFSVKHVDILGGEYESEFGTTPALFSGVAFRGLVFNPDDTSFFPVHPLVGKMNVDYSTLEGMLTAISLGELEDARAKISRNEMRTFVGVDVLDSSRSRVDVQRNQWDVEVVGFQATLNIDGTPSEDNRFLVARNRGRVGSFFGQGTGILVVDPWLLPVVGSSEVKVIDNELDLGDAVQPAFSGIELIGAGRLLVRKNRLRGRVDRAGISIEDTSDCRLVDNVFDGLDTGAGSDVLLGLGTSGCQVVVSADDDVIDHGTDNVVSLGK